MMRIISQISGELYSPNFEWKECLCHGTGFLHCFIKSYFTRWIQASMFNPCWEDDFPLGLDEFSGFLEVLFFFPNFETSPMSGQNWGGRTARRAPASFGRLGLVPRKFQPFTESGFIHLTAGMPCAVPVFKENLRNDWDSRPLKSVYKKIIEVWKMSLL